MLRIIFSFMYSHIGLLFIRAKYLKWASIMLKNRVCRMRCQGEREGSGNAGLSGSGKEKEVGSRNYLEVGSRNAEVGNWNAEDGNFI
jgi:hypothetical protein